MTWVCSAFGNFSIRFWLKTRIKERRTKWRSRSQRMWESLLIREDAIAQQASGSVVWKSQVCPSLLYSTEFHNATLYTQINLPKNIVNIDWKAIFWGSNWDAIMIQGVFTTSKFWFQVVTDSLSKFLKVSFACWVGAQISWFSPIIYRDKALRSPGSFIHQYTFSKQRHTRQNPNLNYCLCLTVIVIEVPNLGLEIWDSHSSPKSGTSITSTGLSAYLDNFILPF